MPGTPANSPIFDIPRYADSDDCSFSEQVNSVTDGFDELAVRTDDPRLADQRTPADGSVTTSKLAAAAVTGTKIAGNTVTETNLAPNSVGAPEIIDGTVGTSELAAGAVTAAKIAAAAVGSGALADGAVLLQKLDALVAQALFTAGDLKISAAATPPAGWLLCDGSTVSRTTYAVLFAAIGTTYGAGDGSTSFNLPDYRGRTIVGAGTGPGLTARTRGQLVGAETHTHSVPGLTVNGHHHPLSANGGARHHVDYSGASGYFYDQLTGPAFTAGQGVLIGVGGSGYVGGSFSVGSAALVGTTDDAGTTTSGGTSGSTSSMQPAGVANVFVKT